jgi:dCTP deaminase
LKKRLESGDLHVMPLFEKFAAEKSNTIDLCLGLEFITMKKGSLAALTFAQATRSELERILRRFYDRVFVGLEHPFILHPGEFVLGATLEYLRLPTTLFGEVTGRSSWGRLGLIIATATAVHPGFKGCLTLELVNHGNIPVELYPGVPIAQIVFHKMQGEQPEYAGRYAGFAGPTGPEWSRIHQGEDIWSVIPGAGQPVH